MDMGFLYTSFEGRINRAKYWLGAIVLGVISLVVLYGSIYAGGGSILEQDSRTRMITLVVQLVFLYPSAALMVKRLQDRNRPGYFAAFILVPLVVKGVTDVMGLTGNPLDQTMLDYVFLAVIVVIGIWFFVEIGCLRGTVGPNQYGPDPLESTPTR
jgi:uncharacterized membrane protein YhaH (DUF805 family)